MLHNSTFTIWTMQNSGPVRQKMQNSAQTEQEKHNMMYFQLRKKRRVLQNANLSKWKMQNHGRGKRKKQNLMFCGSVEKMEFAIFTTVNAESGLLTQLAELHAECNRRIKQCERECAYYRKVFQPWPKKKQASTAKATEEQPVRPDDNVKSVEENPEVLHVKSVLAKAQRLREVNVKKLAKEEELQVNLEKDDEPLVETEGQNANPNTASVGTISQSQVDRLLGRSTTKKQDGNNASRPSVTAKTGKLPAKSNNDFKAPNSISSSTRPVPSKPGAVTKPRRGSLPERSTSRPTTAQSTAVHDSGASSRSSSASRRPPSNTSKPRYTPVHQKAPFQTRLESSRKVPSSRQRPHNPRSVSDLRKGSQSVSSMSETRNPKRATNAVVARSQSHAVINVKPALTSATAVPAAEASAAVDREFEKSVSSMSCASNTSDGMDDSEAQNHHLTDAVAGLSLQSDDPQRTADEPPFNLITDGAKLEVPSRLRRLYMNNLKLRRSLSSSALVQKVHETSTAAEQFMNRMEEHMSESDCEDDVIFQKIQLLANAYRRLHRLFSSVVAAPVTDTSDWKEVLRAKRTVEYVIQSYSHLEETYSSTIQGKSFQNEDPEPPYIPPPQDSSHSVWLPQELDSVHLNPASHVMYRKVRQMDHYNSLLHGIQLFQLQEHVTKQIEEVLLPALHQSPPGSSEAIQLYRSAYSLLCTRGSSFPAMIKDDIEEDSLIDPNDF